MDVAPARRDDAGRDAAAEPERIADRDDPVADLRRAAVAERDIGQRLVCLDLQHGDVGARVTAEDTRRIPAVVLQHDLDLRGFGDDVVVGHDDSGRVDDEAGSERDPLAAPVAGTFGERTRGSGIVVAVIVIEEPAHEVLERRAAKLFWHPAELPRTLGLGPL